MHILPKRRLLIDVEGICVLSLMNFDFKVRKNYYMKQPVMKSIVFNVLLTLMLIFVGVSTVKSQEADSLEIDLATALNIALSENPTVKVADMEIEKKQYAKKTAYGALLPQMDLIGSYQRAIKRQTVYFDEGLGFGGGDIDPTQYTPEELKIMQVVGDMFSMGGDTEGSDEGIQMGRFNVWSAGLNVNFPIIVPSLWKNIQMSDVDI